MFNEATCCFKRHSSSTQYQDLNVLFWTHYNLTGLFISNDNQENLESSQPIAERKNDPTEIKSETQILHQDLSTCSLFH